VKNPAAPAAGVEAAAPAVVETRRDGRRGERAAENEGRNRKGNNFRQ
jgi:hypothetical protein